MLCAGFLSGKTEKGPHKLLLGLITSQSYLVPHSKGQALCFT